MNRYQSALILVSADKALIAEHPKIYAALIELQLQSFIIHSRTGNLCAQHGWQDIGLNELDIDIEACQPNSLEITTRG